MKKIYIIMYHYIRNISKNRFSNLKGLEYIQFKNQLQYLISKNFKFVSMNDLIDYYYRGIELPDKPILLTFDDGYLEHYNYVFPILNKYKIKAAFYPPISIFKSKLLDINKIHILLSEFNKDYLTLFNQLLNFLNYYRGKEFYFEDNEILLKKYAKANRYDSKEIIFIKRILQVVLPEKLRNIIINELFKLFITTDESIIANEYYMNYDQMYHLYREGMHIGIHGNRHKWLANSDKYELKEEIIESINFLLHLINTDCWTICYPSNSYNKNLIKYIHSYGCRLGLTANPGICDFTKNTIFDIPRFDTNDFPPKSENYRSMI